MSILEDINIAVGKMPESARIVYLKSENRHIIEKAVNYSDNFWTFICRHCKTVDIDTERGKRYEALRKLGNMVEYKDFCEQYISAEPPRIPDIFIMRDFQVFEKKTRGIIVKRFLDGKLCGKNSLLIISSTGVYIPDGFVDEIELIDIKPMGIDDIKETFGRGISGMLSYKHSPVSAERLDDAYKLLLGFSEVQIKKILHSVQGHIGNKYEALEEYSSNERENAAKKDPTIRIIEAKREVSGLKGFMRWMNDVRDSFIYDDYYKKTGVSAPKGVVMFGLPGTGKSAAAEMAARMLSAEGMDKPLPLLKFNLASLQSKDYGATETNFENYLSIVDATAPCVLFIDEIEKTFTMGSNTHEVKRQMLNQLLTWMQERTSKVFIFMTLNSVTIPQELIRDERVSERFFVFLPSETELAEILYLMINSFMRDTEIFDEDMKRKFRSESKEDITKDLLEDVIYGITELARNSQRNAFYTGANIRKLVETTNLSLQRGVLRLFQEGSVKEIRLVKDKSEGKALKSPYSYEDYKMALVAQSVEIKTQGENMTSTVDMWFDALNNEFSSASEPDILPLGKFNRDAKSAEECFSSDYKPPEGQYDSYLYEKLSNEIFKKQEEITLRKKLEKKAADR